MIDFLQRIKQFEGESPITRKDITKVLRTVLKRVSEYDPNYPEHPNHHADIVKECTRLLKDDERWLKAFESNPSMAKSFHLDALIAYPNEEYRKIGENMGALLMVKVPSLEVSDIANEDYSMAKISEALVRYVLNSQAKQQHIFEREINELRENQKQLMNRDHSKIQKEISDLHARWDEIEKITQG